MVERQDMRERDIDRDIERQRQRQTDRQTDRQRQRHVGFGHTDRLNDRQTPSG